MECGHLKMASLYVNRVWMWHFIVRQGADLSFVSKLIYLRTDSPLFSVEFWFCSEQSDITYMTDGCVVFTVSFFHPLYI